MSLFLFICCISSFSLGIAEFESGIVWGPGIERPELTLPVRYFYLQLVGSDGKNLTYPPSESFISFGVSGESLGDRRDCRAGTQVIDRKDGSYILRYKLVLTCSTLQIYIRTSDGRPLSKSPIRFQENGPFYPDDCYCPFPSLETWAEEVGCPSSYKQIKLDMASWPKKSVNFSNVLSSAKERWASHPGAHSFCHYIFLDNRIFRNCYGQHVGFKMFSDAIFLSMARKFKLPDTEFLMNLGDWPLEKRNENPIPMISWCGSVDTKDIILPTYELTEATLEAMGRQSLDIQSVQGMVGPSWAEKIGKAVFRGRDSRQERLDLVEMSLSLPDLIEAGITRFFFFKDVKERYGPEVEHVPFGHFFKFRYVINVDGTVAAYRLPYLLVGNSLVLKQDSPYYEHFYGEFKPWIHFVPLKRNLSDTVEKIQWAKDNEDEVLKMIDRSKVLARKILEPKEIFCYHARVFAAYEKILSSEVEGVPQGMEVVEQKKEPYTRCSCIRERDFSKNPNDEL